MVNGEWAKAAVFACVTLAGWGALPRSTQTPEVSVRAVTAAAARYLAEYEGQSSFLLSDETYTQRVVDSSGREAARRTMTSESFSTFVPASRIWISIRDVMEVDGRRVEPREDLRALLQSRETPRAARSLAERNARYNIGSISRNFNEPTLGLLIFETERRPQFRFERRDVKADGSTTLVTLAFKEVDTPTLIRAIDGPPVFSTGEVTVEAGTGRIRRTTIEMKHGPIVAVLTTDYALDPKLDMWVPATFTERYDQKKNPRQQIFCEARYTNYRRFDVTSRIR